MSASNQDDDKQMQKIAQGFRIETMRIRNPTTGEVFWKEGDWGPELFRAEISAHLPGEILEHTAVAREVEFSSQELIEDFWVKQNILLDERCIEEWEFYFGFVIPQSTNSWEQIIETAQGQVLPKDILSGNLVVETVFYTGEKMISKGRVRIYYD